MTVTVGCCGFAIAQAAYFRRFSLIEIQQTFYEPPQRKTAERWRAQAPPDFIFTLKAWQLITHEVTSPTYRRLRTPLPRKSAARVGDFRPTAEVMQAWERTREIAMILRAPVVVFQSPQSFRPTAEHIRNIRRFFTTIERGKVRCGWEPRGEWPDSIVKSLCRQLDLLHVVDPFQRQPVTAGLRYFRLHGVRGYSSRYTDQDLARLASLSSPEETTYCLFNNVTMAGDAARFLALTPAGASGREKKA